MQNVSLDLRMHKHRQTISACNKHEQCALQRYYDSPSSKATPFCLLPLTPILGYL